jgi:hypothetical protein
MTDRPEFFRYAPAYGTVYRVYPKSWEVDVLASNGGIIPRAIVLGARLPEESTEQRPQWVVVLWSEATDGQTYALPVPSRLPGLRYQRSELVLLEEVQGWKISIKAPGNTGVTVAGQTGELEIRSEKGGRTLQLRIQEQGGVIRLDTPKTHVVMHDDVGDVAVECDRDATVDAGRDVGVTAGRDINATAAQNISAEAGGNVTVDAPAGTITATAGVAVTVEAPAITATATVTASVAAPAITVTGAVTVTIAAPTINLIGTVNVTGILNVL